MYLLFKIIFFLCILPACIEDYKNCEFEEYHFLLLIIAVLFWNWKIIIFTLISILLSYKIQWKYIGNGDIPYLTTFLFLTKKKILFILICSVLCIFFIKWKTKEIPLLPPMLISFFIIDYFY